MPRRTGRRTDYQWFNSGDLEADNDLGVGTGVFGSTAFEFGQAQTLTRLRGKVGVYLDAGAGDESAMILCGFTVIPEDMFTGGTAPEIFNASVDETSWVWQGALYVAAGLNATAVEDGQFDRIEIDSKAMRRVKANSVLAFVFQAPAALVNDVAGTFDLTWQVHGLVGS